jgi:hypothetical protein
MTPGSRLALRREVKPVEEQETSLEFNAFEDYDGEYGDQGELLFGPFNAM